MVATAVSVGKAVLDGALGYAKSKAAEETALHLGIERDVDFITDELHMMQSFLEMADEGNGQNKVFMAWVKQIRDLAYKVEDSLMDFGLQSEKKPSWWCIPCSTSDRRRIATEMKELRAKVEDVSNRNLRYSLVLDHKDSAGSKPTVAEKQATIARAAMFAINEATLGTLEQEKSEVDLHSLITSEEEDLRVIAMWGTSGDYGKTSAIQEVYSKVLKKFAFCAWVRLMYPFNPQEFLRSLVRQFYENSHDEVGKQESKISVAANISAKMEKMNQSDLSRVFSEQLCSNSYLIFVNDLSTIEEWHCIQMYFPNNKKQSRIIVSTQNVEIACLCTEKPYQVSELKQVSCDQTIYLFHKKNTDDHSMTSATVAISTTNEDMEEKKNVHASSSVQAISDLKKFTTTKVEPMPTSEIQQEDEGPEDPGEGKVCNSTAIKKFNRIRTLALVDGVLTGRETEKSSLIELVGQPDNNQGLKVISVWGMGGLGKTTLVGSVYRSQELAIWKHAWVTALRPFNPEVLLRDLALQLQKSIQEDIAGGASTKGIALMKIQELKVELARLLKTQNCLVVLDDISSTDEWDLVKGCLDNAGRIIITTREKNIAEHCSSVYKNIYNLEGLKDAAALDLFSKKVFKDNTEKVDFVPAMMEQARIILKKCRGLPLAISTIGGFLATKPKTAIEWRMMNDRISAELEINPELRTIQTALMRSYDCLPYYLKSALLYLSIFQEDQKIRLDRLVSRWVAEGYARDMHGITAEQLGHRYFVELLDRSMILPGEDVNHPNGKINSCQLHDIIREICISKARDENLVFTLEDGCCLGSTQGPIRHLVIGSNWKRDEDALVTALDLSHVRSLTVFGEWRPFFISKNMRFLRVLDLEDTLGLRDHHLDFVGQLHHLKYLSLRECRNIFCLPNSLGNLRHLQTLDVRGTHIYELPTTITNLGKLQNLRAPSYLDRKRNVKGEDDILDEYLQYFDDCLMFKGFLLLRPKVLASDFNRRDVLNLCRFAREILPGWKNLDSEYGAKVPRGIGRLKALHTLGGASVTWDKGTDTVKEFRELTELHKLGVVGIGVKNKMEFWSAIAGHYHLRSLSVRGHPLIEHSYMEYGVPMFDDLDSCLGEGLSPPRWLESLKLYGRLVRVTC